MTHKMARTTVFSALRKDRKIRWARRMLIALIVISVFAGFIANDKPLYCKTSAGNDFPIFREMLSSIGIATWTIEDAARNWRESSYDRVIFPPIPYLASTTDLQNANFRGPFDQQQVPGIRFRHWLGTDQLGRDVLAGLVHGTRIALLVGLLSMLLAAGIGIPIGAASGYLGDDRIRMTLPMILSALIGIMSSLYLLSLSFSIEGRSAIQCFAISLLILIATIFLIRYLRKRNFSGRMIRVPVDSMTLRSIEVLRSIPGFFLLFAILGMVRTPRLIYVILLIAILYAPTVIRYIRAEALKLRRETYIQSAEVLGLSARQIIFRHVIPNAIGPVMITLAFGTGAAVLIESGLSFLGIGVAPEVMTWGKMLNSARANFSAWWLAILPGIAIFLTIALFNRLGDYLESCFGGRI